MMKLQKLDAFKSMSLEKEALSCLFGGADQPTDGGNFHPVGAFSADTISHDSAGNQVTEYHKGTGDKSTAADDEVPRA